jgi:replicative DNA helicase
MIDFAENIDSLELMVWNFILNPDNDSSALKPSNDDSLSREDLITRIYPKYFNHENRFETYKHALKFFKEYSKIPNKKELASYLELKNCFIEEDEISDLYMFNLGEYNYKYLYEYVTAFIMIRNLNLTMFDMIAYLKTASVDPTNIDTITEKIRNDINNKLSIDFSNNSKGLNFMDPASHIQIPKIGTPSGFDFINKTQGGGWNLKTLVVFQGRPKVGKSMVLGNVAARSFLAGNNTGLVTVELADRSYMKRIGANILEIKKDDYEKINDIESASLVRNKINQLKSSGQNIGHLEVVEFPTGGATAIDIENYFIRLESKLNKKFKVIVVDYLNLLKPIQDQSGLYEKVKMICEQLRGAAMRNEWCIISATQIRRDDVENYDLGMDSVAESFGLVHTVDALYGLMRSPLEGRMKIKVIANRDNGFEESYKFYSMHKDYFKLIEENSPNSEYYSDDDLANQLQDQIRKETETTLNTPSTSSDVENKESTEQVSEMSDDSYDELFNSL